MTDKNIWDMVVVGGANMDYLVRGPKLPKPGETLMGNLFQEAPGGKGANQAVAAARLGARVALVARVGADERGKAILRQLNDEGVDTRYATVDEKEGSGVALVLVGEGGEKEILTAPGANRQLSINEINHAVTALQSTRMLLIQLGIPLETALQAVELSYSAEAKIILDPSPPVPLSDQLLRMISLIKPNAREAEALTGIQVRDRVSARNAAKRLIKRGVGAVAVQAGEEGNLIVTAEEEHWFPKIPIQSIDATGAGDAFAVALSVALLEGRPWQEVGAWASAAAALKTTKLGAQAGLPTRDQILELLAKNKIAPDS